MINNLLKKFISNFNFSIFNIFLIIIFFFIFYNTGIHGDDYYLIFSKLKYQYLDFIKFSENYYSDAAKYPIGYYLFWWVYFFLEIGNLYLLDVIKFISHVLCVYFVFFFLSDYFDRDKSLIISLLFIFYPSHDSTTYFYMLIPYIFCPSLIMFCHFLMHNGSDQNTL